MHVGKLVRGGLVQVAFLGAAAFWLGSLAVLVVLTFAPTEDPTAAWSLWSTAVVLLVTLPVLVVFGRRAFRAERRIGPRVDLEETEEDVAARHHKGIDGEIPPPARW